MHFSLNIKWTALWVSQDVNQPVTTGWSLTKNDQMLAGHNDLKTSTHNHKSLVRQIAIPWAIQQERAEGRSGGYGRGERRTGRSRGATLRALQNDRQRRCDA